MTWKDITVEQYQALAPIIRDKSLSDLEQEALAVGLLNDRTEQEIDALPWEEYVALRRSIAFLSDEEPPFVYRPEVLTAESGRRYRVNYDPYKQPLARYAEINHFLRKETPEQVPEIDNLHKLLASICTPEGEKYDAARHSVYAEDLRTVKYIEARGVTLFFCLFYYRFLTTTAGYLAEKLAEREKIEITEARRIIGALTAAMGGYITSNVLPTSSA